jgi:hypothetical protein
VELRGVSRSMAVSRRSPMSFAISFAAPFTRSSARTAPASRRLRQDPDRHRSARQGEIAIEGAVRRISDPQAAHGLGIVAMYQEPTVFEDLSALPRTSSPGVTSAPASAPSTGGDARRDSLHPR